MNEKELISLIRCVKEIDPNAFSETIGIMKGIKIMDEKNNRKVKVQKEQST